MTIKTNTRDNDALTKRVASFIRHAITLTRDVTYAHVDATRDMHVRSIDVNNAFVDALRTIDNIDVDAIILRIVDDIRYDNV